MEEDPWANNILSRITLHSEGAAHVRLVRAAWNAVHTIHPTCLSQRNNTIPRTEGGENVFSTDTARSYLVLGHHQHVSGNKEKTWGVISLTSASCSLTFLFFLPPDLYWKCKCQPYVCTESSTLLPEHAASWKMALNDLLNRGTSTRADTITAREGGQRFRGCAAP